MNLRFFSCQSPAKAIATMNSVRPRRELRGCGCWERYGEACGVVAADGPPPAVVTMLMIWLYRGYKVRGKMSP